MSASRRTSLAPESNATASDGGSPAVGAARPLAAGFDWEHRRFVLLLAVLAVVVGVWLFVNVARPVLEYANAPEPIAHEVVTLAGHSGPVTSVAFSPDGRWALTGSNDGAAKLWRLDARGGARAAATLAGHSGSVTSVAFSPDGRWALTGSMDAAVRLWRLDGQGGAHKTALLGLPLTIAVHSVAFSPDNTWALVGASDHSCFGNGTVWRVPIARPLGVFGPQPATRVGFVFFGRPVALAPDGLWALTGGDDGTAALWRIADAGDTQPVATLAGQGAEATSAAFSPDGRWALIGTADGTTKLWRLPLDKLAAGQANLYVPPSATFAEHPGAVRSVVFSPDGRWALTGSSDATAKLWRLPLTQLAAGQTGLSVSPFATLGHHAGWVNAVAFSPSGRWVLTGSDDGTAKLWRLDLRGSGAARGWGSVPAGSREAGGVAVAPGRP